jgi:mRNA interferase RelE/StbE
VKYTVRLRGGAGKEYRTLPTAVRGRVLDHLIELEQDPRPEGARMLSGEFGGHYRLRVGDHRIVYVVDDDERSVSVTRIRPRGQAYQ